MNSAPTLPYVQAKGLLLSPQYVILKPTVKDFILDILDPSLFTYLRCRIVHDFKGLLMQDFTYKIQYEINHGSVLYQKVGI